MPFLIILPTAALVESFMLTLQPTVMSQSTTSLLTDNVPLTDSLVTDKLLTHKLAIQFVTDKLVIVAFVAISLVTDKFEIVALVSTASVSEIVPVNAKF